MMHARRRCGQEARAGQRWRRGGSLAGWLALLAVLANSAGPAAAQPPRLLPAAPAASRAPNVEPAAPRERLQFRRVFAPADQADRWPLEPGRYLPLDAGAFEQLVDAAQADPATRGAQLMSAEYEAQLVGGKVLIGRARWRILQSSPQPTLVRLEPCNAAIGEATWVRDDGPRPAVLGSRQGGGLAALVEESGMLECPWSSSGETIGPAALGFHLELPECPINRLLLDLPLQMTVVPDHGVVARVPDAPDGYGRWRIESGGRSRLNLRVVGEESAVERRQLLLVRQSTTYAVSPRGVDVVAELRLDVHNEPLSRLSVQLDPGMRLVGAKIGEAIVPWTVSSDGPDRPARAVLEFSEPVLGVGRILRLSGLAPLDDGLHRLPSMRPEGAFWQEGTATLLVPAPLKVLDLQLQGARQTRVTPLAGPEAGESIELQFFRPDAAVELAVARPEVVASVRSGTQITRGASEALARMLVQMNVREGEQFVVRARVNDGWKVEAVDSQTTQSVVDWNLSRSSGGTDELVVQLSDSVSPRNPLRLVVSARKQVPANRVWNARDLLPLDFSDTRWERRLAAVRTGEPWQLALSGAESLARLDPARLAVADASLFTDLPEGLAFVVDDGAADLSLRLVDGQPHISVEWNLEAVARPDRLEQTCRASIKPEAGNIERLLVHFSHAHPQLWNWSLAGDDAAQANPALSARRLSPNEQAALGVGEPGETWEIALRPARALPFELVAQRTQPLGSNQPIDLAAVLDVEDQRGTITVRASESLGLHIKSQRLKAVPFEALAGPNRLQQASYRYEPRRDALSPNPALILSAAEIAQPLPTAWAWSLDVESRFGDGIPTVHVATWLLENNGRTSVELSVPPDAALVDVWVDGQALSRELAADARGKLSVQLPPGSQWVVVRAAATAPGTAVRWAASVAPPAIELDLPVMHKLWRLWLPHDLEIVAAPESVAPDFLGRTWSQRLFGPLGRGDDGGPFNPFAAASWFDAAGISLADPGAKAVLDEFIDRLGQALIDPERPAGLTWGQVLVDCGRLGEREARLVVDAVSLDAAEITPRTLVPAVLAGSARVAATRALAAAGISVATTGRTLVITTPQGISLWRPTPEALAEYGGVVLHAGPRAAGIDHAQAASAASRWFPADRWDSEPRRPAPTWSVQRGGTSNGPATAGRTYLLNLPPESSVLVVGRSTTLAAGFWAVLLGAVAASSWTGRLRRTFWCGLAAVAGSLALLLPAWWSLLLGPIFLASLICLALHSVQRRTATTVGDRSSAAAIRLSRVTQATATLAIIAALVASAMGHGETAPTEDRVPTVFVPVDADGRPTNGRVQVPEDFYQELHRRASAATNEPRGCLIRHAVYRAALARESAQKRWGVTELRAELDLVAFEANATLRLPFAKATSSLGASSVRLDGRAVVPSWVNDESELVLTVRDSGPHRLELVLDSPEVKSGLAGVDLPVPVVGSAQLELTAPADAPGVDLPTARGQSFERTAEGVIRAELGPSDRLQIAWQEGSAANNSAMLDVEELLWMQVQPGSVALQVKLRCKAGEQPIERIRVLTDARLRLLPVGATDLPVSVVVGSLGDRRTIDLEPSRPAAEPLSIDLKFLLTGTSGLGNLRLPLVEVAGARVSRRLLAVSIDSALDYEEQTDPAAAELRPLAVPEFLAAWGAHDVQPQTAYAMENSNPSWILATRPRETRLTYVPHLALGVGRETAALRWSASIASSEGNEFLLRIAVPPAVEVDRVAASAEGVDLAARWTKTNDETLTVFLSSELAEESQLTIEGRAACPSQGSWNLPSIHIPGADESSGTLAIYQQPSMMVRAPDGLASLEDIQPPSIAPGWGAPVGLYRTNPEDRVSVELRPNAVRAETRLAVSMDRDDAGWMARTDIVVNLRDGWLDAVRLNVPPQWNGPFSLDQPGTLEVVGTPGGRERMLVVRPHMPLMPGGAHFLTIRGRVVAGAGERLRVPNISLVGLIDVERFIVLPKQIELQTIAWETLGLLPSELPVELETPLSAGTFSAYRAPGERFDAALRVMERATPEPLVRLADICAWRQGQTLTGVAAFTVDPAGADSCILEFPPGQRPLAIRVGGAPAVWSTAEPGRLRIVIGPQQLPQLLEVVFAGHGDDAAATADLQVPSIADFRCERTLLTTCSAPSGRAAPQNGGSPNGDSIADRVRLDVLGDCIRLATDVSAEQPPKHLTACANRWRAEFDWLSSRMAWQFQAADTVARSAGIDGNEKRLSLEVEAALQKLPSGAAFPAGAASRTDAPRPTPAYLTVALDQLARFGQPPVERERAGKIRSLPIDWAGATQGTFWRRATAALALAICLVGLAYAAARAPQARISAESCGILSGLGTWLWLQPSAIGLAVALFCLLARARHARGGFWKN